MKAPTANIQPPAKSQALNVNRRGKTLELGAWDFSGCWGSEFDIFNSSPPQIVSLPYNRSENNQQWQQDLLRNAALTTGSHTIHSAGLHTLKIWRVDPGIVIDTIATETGPEQNPGYTWPAETRRLQPN